MERRYSTPQELVDALQHRGPGARAQLWELLHHPMGRLLDGLIARYQLKQDRELLLQHALHAAETYLRTQPAGAFTSLTWDAFRAGALLQVARMAAQPFGRRQAPASARPTDAKTPIGPLPLPPSSTYHSETLFLPHERVGPYWFGGDWFAGAEGTDGSLWVIVADITGHGYYAYLLASALPEVWRSCWQKHGPEGQPADLLAAMHDLLEDCLPEGVYVECTLVRLDREGEAVVAPAGGTRLLLRRGEGRPDLHKLRGTWLGLARPSVEDQKHLALADGDELLLGSDGLYDQLIAHLGGEVEEHLGSSAGQATLFEAVHRLLGQALQREPQKDDITMVLLRRRDRSASGVPGTTPADTAARSETGDVPV
jgi:serine phosphatase RsbU (regulator of sigma subunit)